MTAPRSPASQILLDVLLLLLATALILLAAAALSESSRIHINVLAGIFNDQAGYISGARHFAEHGVIKTHLIYPSSLLQLDATRNDPYMPGYYYVLGWVYKFFGYGVAQTLWPNFVGFFLAVGSTYLLGRKLSSRPVALLAGILLLAFPPHLLLSFLAMAEMTLLGVTAACLVGFVYTPLRVLPFVGPLFLVPPFLFRDTGAFLAAPMVLILYFGFSNLDLPKGRRLLLCGVFLILSVLLLLVIRQSPLCAGRISLLHGHLFDGRSAVVYGDAVALADFASRPKGELLAAMGKQVLRNLELVKTLGDGVPGESATLASCVLLLVGSLYMGFFRRDLLGLCTASLLLLTMVFASFGYVISGYRLVRLLLYAGPFCSLFAAHVIDVLVGQLSRLRATVYAVVLALLGSAASLWGTHRAYATTSFFDPIDQRNLGLMEQTGHDNRTLLAAPELLSMVYAYAHYPVQVSLVPRNKETLVLLTKKFPVGTVLLPKGDPDVDLRPADLESLGFQKMGVLRTGGFKLDVFRGPPPR